ncbi:MAG: (Fe-S)-binding protein [Desulfobacterales bacterium]|nr:(Fe-S)-binding protein [Desulfobacterales bacterium]
MQYEEILHRCFRCGYCKLPEDYTDINCPSYLKYRFETYSPGGRMWLLRAFLNKKIEATKRYQEILFSCATCGNCTEHCTFPKFKDQLLLAFTAGKGDLIQEGKVPKGVGDCLTKIQKYGNPYGLARKNRANWTKGLDIETYSDQEFLFYVGDVGSYDEIGQEITQSLVRLLKHLDISFGILGADEISDGNDVKAMGEADLFNHLAEENIKKFNALGVKKIITLSPHGFNIMKNDYTLLGGRFQVFHYSQILAAHMGDLTNGSEHSSVRVTFHDPCYLGRHNFEYTAARNVLGTLPFVDLIEMDRFMQNALCCGGGGGNIFSDVLGSGSDTSARVRIREAIASGAQVLAVACPTCAVMLTDALKTENSEGVLEVKELSQIINEYLV